MAERIAPDEGPEPGSLAKHTGDAEVRAHENAGSRADESRALEVVRDILVGDERRKLEALERRVDSAEVTPESVASTLPEAIFMRSGRDRQLAIALAPTVEGAISDSVRRHPQQFATAIFPVLGPAIRKAISEAMASLVASVNASIGHTFTLRGLRWRMESWRTGVPFAQVVIKHSLVYRVEQVLLIHAHTGLLLRHATSPDLITTDGDLISGMMTAIRDFVNDSFTQEHEVGGGLRRFSVGEHNVIVEQGPSAVLAAVVRGEAPDSLVLKLTETLETIHLRFASELDAFEGDGDPFAPTQELLEDCLETVLSSTHVQSESERRRGWLPWALIATLLLVTAGVLLRQRNARWQSLIAGIEREPGLVLVRAEHGWFRSRLSGLRDPQAARVPALLSSLGADTTRIAGQWQPYIALDSALVVRRAAVQFGAPTTVTMSLHSDTLLITGAAPVEWIARTEGYRLLPSGISTLSLSSVKEQLPDDVVSAMSAVEQHRVLFATGSAHLNDDALATLRTNASALARLDSTLDAWGRHIDIQLFGRADATGADSSNQALSGLRVEAVKQELSARGVPGTNVSAQALGTQQPLPAPDDSIRARNNRSVSFAVRVARNARIPNSR